MWPRSWRHVRESCLPSWCGYGSWHQVSPRFKDIGAPWGPEQQLWRLRLYGGYGGQGFREGLPCPGLQRSTAEVWGPGDSWSLTLSLQWGLPWFWTNLKLTAILPCSSLLSLCCHCYHCFLDESQGAFLDNPLEDLFLFTTLSPLHDSRAHFLLLVNHVAAKPNKFFKWTSGSILLETEDYKAIYKNIYIFIIYSSIRYNMLLSIIIFF